MCAPHTVETRIRIEANRVRIVKLVGTTTKRAPQLPLGRAKKEWKGEASRRTAATCSRVRPRQATGSVNAKTV
ncbi:hypothetical protein CIW54_11235 [Paraburkholderia sp. T12-10]|nr:hypothetical protein CIW54_11235 [Paraburkholderia sp. T12-10]